MDVLIVEDDALVALSLADAITMAGHSATGIAYSAATAMRLIAHGRFDCAVLDHRLGSRDTARPVAQELRQRGIPFVWVTGLEAEWAVPGEPVLRKPFLPEELLPTLEALVGAHALAQRKVLAPALH